MKSIREELVEVLFPLMVDFGELEETHYENGPTVYEDLGGGIYTEPDFKTKDSIVSKWIKSVYKGVS